MSWNPFSSKPAPAESKYDSSSEYIEDPYADPFSDDDEGAGFSSIQLPPRAEPIDVIRERPGQDDDSDEPRHIKVDFNTLIGANPAARSAVYGVAPKKQSAKDAAFLKFSRRNVYERSMYNTGCMYLAGIATGGVIGFFEGASKMSGMRLKIRLNSIFNNCGRRGALTGNAFGLFAMMFTFTEDALETVDLEHYMHQIGLPRSDFTIPAIAAGLTGMMYRLPAAMSAPRYGLLTLIAAGAVGASCMAGISMLGPKVFGEKAPFGF